MSHPTIKYGHLISNEWSTKYRCLVTMDFVYIYIANEKDPTLLGPRLIKRYNLFTENFQ